MPDREDSTRSLLGLIERLVDNLQETNKSNTDMLRSVNISLTKLSDSFSEVHEIEEHVENVEKKVESMGGNELLSTIRSFTTKVKILTAIITVILTLGLFILGLTQFKLEANITSSVRTEMREITDNQTKYLDQQFRFYKEDK